MDIWVQSVGGKKKGRVKGLGSLDIDEMIKAQINASNADLYAQLQNERHKNKKMRKELDLLIKHVYKKSLSNERSSQEDNQAYENESDDDSNSMNERDSDPNNLIVDKFANKWSSNISEGERGGEGGEAEEGEGELEEEGKGKGEGEEEPTLPKV
ncbi:hypothetical protein KY284_001407 [Solanum tuberosum]|nr:hypothetical protein KY284_001407 [Solanum tuberosum]